MSGYSLHIGLNHVSPAHYGSDQPLKNAVADAVSMKAIAANSGFANQSFLDNAATAGAVAGAMVELARKARAGDIVFISYAGHGSQMFDGSGDEPDSLDETWCLYDRMMLDDELYGLYSLFETGVRVLVVSDSCHSGTVARVLEDDDGDFTGLRIFPPFRALDEAVARSAFLENADRYGEVKALATPAASAELRCALQLFAACQDNQLAGDGDGNGYFTKHLLHAWADGAFAGSYIDLFAQLSSAMPRQQKPNRQVLGRDDAAYYAQRPFTI